MNKNKFNSSNVTVAVLNYNGIDIIPDCLNSIRELQTSPGEVIMVDDGSRDGSPAFVKEQYPWVRVIEMGFNSKRLNMVRNRALRESTGDVVLLVDNDVAMKSDCLVELLHGLNKLSHAAVCMPRTLYKHDPSTIYQDGQVLHYVGATYAMHRNAPLSKADSEPRRSIGWGVQLIDKRKAEAVGYFNEEYVMGWGDDGEFNHRMNLTGYFCYNIPSAIVFHGRVAGARRYYGTVRNRLRFIFECYQWKTILLCAPALVVYELSLFLFMLVKGAAADYFKAIAYFLANFRSVISARRKIQPLRKLRDSELMDCGSIFIDQGYVNSPILVFGYNTLNKFLNAYWKVIKALL